MLELIKNDYVITIFTLLIAIIYFITAYRVVKYNKLISIAILTNMLLVYILLQYTLSTSLTTTIIMPGKNNLRLAEDGKLSFCLNDKARTWIKTQNGIISTKKKYIDGRRMKCLSLEQSLELLARNGATQEQLNAIQEIYKNN